MFSIDVDAVVDASVYIYIRWLLHFYGELKCGDVE